MKKMKPDSWLYVLIGVIILLFDGMVYAWSVLQRPIAACYPDWSKTQLSLTFTLCMCSFCLGGLLAGKISRKVQPRLLMAGSAVLFLIAFTLTSRAETLAALYLGFGLLGGFSSGVVYNIVMSTLSKRFAGKQGLVSGILLMGFGLGSFFIGKIYQAVTPVDAQSFTWRGSFFGMGVMICVVILLGSPFFSWIQEPAANTGSAIKKQSEFEDMSPAQMIRRPSFWLFFSWVVLTSFAGMVLISQASGVVLEVQPNLDGSVVATVVGLISIFNGVGRVLFGGMFDRFGRRKTINLINLAWLGSVALLLISLLIGNFVLTVVSFICCGLSYGGITPTNSAFIHSFYGSKNFPSNFSIVNLNLLIASFGGTAAGLVYDSTGSYLSALALMAIAIILASIISSQIRRP